MSLEPANGTTFVTGPNFSGRSAWLRAQTREHGGIFIPPELEVSLSGMRLTLADELRLHERGQGTHPLTNILLALAGLDERSTQNPTTLSGGELALFILTCKLSLGRPAIAVDCVFEQMAPTLKKRVLGILQGHPERVRRLLIADNRSEELPPALRGGGLVICVADSAAHELKLDSSVAFDRPAARHTLEMSDLMFGYIRNKPVLNGVAARLEPGRVYWLEGSNGSGKSTLAKLLTGVLKPQAGQIRVDGALIRPFDQPGQLVSYVYQDPDVQFVGRDVGGDLRLGLQDEPGRSIESRLQSAVRAFGLGPVLDKEILSLPYVLRKRVAVASAFAALRPWLILDEPTLGQDDETVESLARTINALAALGYGIIIISHSIFLRSLIGPITLRLQDGRLRTPPHES